ncbi:DUF4129 domain-containing transglutaminase family protein [Caldalkalibacillus mannanilyticus]|uniref:DUF4129 domain-containing transglutaminase family protein n=1 Tax=Caldalkalibacillus mannanilyticus TaxID=1418 RepID=UPI000468A608|nr:transglutaminase domain-containing protein [Caldalkalibacillus mannanilyticus]
MVQRVGYSDQDEFLGGPFVQDSKIVFKATTPKKHYWRGESKDYYTGHGWINTSKYPERYAPQHFNDFLLHDEFKLYEEEVKIEEIEIDVQMKSRRYSTLFYPGEPTRVHLDPLGEEVQVDRREGHITFWENQEQPNHYSEYQMKSTYPKFQIKALREASMNEVPSEIMNRYTQLPNTLPARVGELAEELTKNDENPYDKVKKIEGFFRRFGYEYETKDVPIPKEGQDYVDQFVFETKRGYCNNFSTSMVVMLRTVGIPARWVKGFTFGEITAQERGVYTTQVRNLNAHSWVEVYFPGSGWVPFEPTKAYDNPYPFEIDRTTPDTSSLPDMTDLEQRLKQDFPDIPERDQEDRDVAGAGSKSKPWYQSKYFTISLSVFFALGVLGVLFYWKKIMISWIIARYRRNQDPQLFLKAYEVMLQLVGKWVVRRDPSQTMREYVVALESRVSQEELRPLTKIFEEMRYGNKKTEEGQLHKAYQLWERVLKKMRS